MCSKEPKTFLSPKISKINLYKYIISAYTQLVPIEKNQILSINTQLIKITGKYYFEEK